MSYIARLRITITAGERSVIREGSGSGATASFSGSSSFQSTAL